MLRVNPRHVVVVALTFLGTSAVTVAFVPSHHRFAVRNNQNKKKTLPILVARNLLMDPSVFHDLPNHVDSLRDAFTSLTLSDALDTLTDAVTSVDLTTPASTADASDAVSAAAAAAVSAAANPDAAAQAAADAQAAAAANNNGWFGFLTGPIEGLLQLIHSALVAVGVSSDAWGVSIVALTVLIKLVTLPLTRSQLESTNKMQALQPAIKSIQEKYGSNQEVMNQKIAEVYQVNDVNPLAGCIPSLVQIPVFIGLYRAVFTLAKDDKLNEPFLWLPNLEGPTYGADPTHGSDWILQGWNNGVPSLGWDATIAFLVLPLVLVISQYVSMELMQPKDGPSQNNFVLKLLPLMIGWFSLTVPAALSIYWVTNNIITTATTLLIKNSMNLQPVVPGASTTTTASQQQPQTIFAPPRQKPTGFSPSAFRDEDVKPVTAASASAAAAIDAEIVKKREVDDDEEDDGDDDAVQGAPSESVASTSAGTGMEAPTTEKKEGSDKKKKRRKRKN